MLADPRSKAMIDNFTFQWLGLKRLQSFSPDPIVFPDFDENLRRAFNQETMLLAETIARENRSVVDFLNADYTFVNERLARHYGIRNVYGSHFRRVELTDPVRHGLLGEGAVLMVTSYPNRTSPVLRGKWLLENILGIPPPPPPPNVPALQEAAPGQPPASMRARMEQHRANPVCASCHKVMDPLGFALEPFDAVGRFRTVAAGSSDGRIDATGTLPDGTPFDGPNGLRTALVEKRLQFVRTVTQKLLIYALGRGVEASDAPAVRAIVRAAGAHDYRW